jgi:hypothetical protein
MATRKATQKSGKSARAAKNKRTSDNQSEVMQAAAMRGASDCGRVATFLAANEPSAVTKRSNEVLSDVGIFFIVEAAAIAQLVIIGYNLVGKPNDPVPQTLGKALNVLDAVQARIDQINGRFDNLIRQIDQLESRIKGHVDAAFVRDSLAYVNAKSLILQPLLRDENTLKAELTRVTTNMDELLTHLVRVRDHSNGLFAGAFNMAPGISLWVQTFMAAQRAKGTHLTSSVWDQPFHVQNMNMLQELFRVNDQVVPQYNRELSEMPDGAVHARAYEYTQRPTEKFVPSNLPFKQQYEDNEGRPNLFRVEFWNSNNSYEFMSTQRVRLIGSNPRWIWSWRSVDRYSPISSFPDPATVGAAYKLRESLNQRRALIKHHFGMMREAPYYRDQIRTYCENKPVAWGGSAPVPTTALVHLLNDRWDSVNVEVRRGKEANCGNNAAFETRRLERSEIWTIPAPDVDICYRRDLNPDQPPSGQWTDWRRVTVTQDTEYWESIR